MKACEASPDIAILDILHSVEFGPKKQISPVRKMFILNAEVLALAAKKCKVFVFGSSEGSEGVRGGTFESKPGMASFRIPAKLRMILDRKTIGSFSLAP